MTITERKPLARRQQEVHDHVAAFTELHGYPPTYREIGEGLGISVNAVAGHVQALVIKGYATHIPGKNRTLRLIGGSDAV